MPALLHRLRDRFRIRPPAAPTTEALPDAITRQVRAIEIRARSLLREQFLGEFRSAFRGRGLEFSEIRLYQPGDDVRCIDWNVTARRGEPYLKQFVEEREQTVLLLLDVSGSTTFGTVGRSVGSYALEVAGLLGYAAALSNDRVGVVAFADTLRYTQPPRKGVRNVLRLLRDLIALPPAGGGTDLPQALDYAARLARRGSVIFVLSDFLADNWDASLRRLAYQHDVVALVVHDPHEATLPGGGLLALEDSEHGGVITVDADAAAIRLRAARAGRLAALPARLRTAGVDVVLLPTDQPYLPRLVALFRARVRRP